ncbi:MAG: ExbD/TolR family protein [Alphaproteobacteria bacterium]
MNTSLLAIRKLKRKKKIKSEINITSLIDVMMVLLVIFMVAAPLMTTGIKLELPKVGGKELATDDTSINISIDKDGLFYIGKTEVPADKIIAKLNAIREANKDVSIVISGDNTTEYGRVIGLMALLKDAGFLKVGLKTDPKK